MEIKYFGHSCFQLKGKEATVVTDPFDPKMVGMKLSKMQADILTVSHQHGDHNFISLVEGSPLIINLPGEYEQKGVRITGIPTYHDKNNGAERGKNILFKIEIDDVSILHAGDLGHLLDDETLADIGEVQVLMVPVGGFYTISADDAIQVIKQIEPGVVIPMHYGHQGLDPELASKLTSLDEFITKMGITPPEKVKKFSVKKEDMSEEMKVVIMDIS